MVASRNSGLSGIIEALSGLFIPSFFCDRSEIGKALAISGLEFEKGLSIAVQL